MVFCPECGTENENDAKFCSKCGNKLNNKTPKSKSDKNLSSLKSRWKKQNNTIKVLIISACVILGIVLLLAVFGYFSNDYVPPELENMTITNSKGYHEFNGLYSVEGTVQNNNPYGVGIVGVKVIGYDSNGKIVSSDTDYINGDDKHHADIPAYDSRDFYILLDDPDGEIASYHAQVDYANEVMYGHYIN